jgi:hypothetical protein
MISEQIRENKGQKEKNEDQDIKQKEWETVTSHISKNVKGKRRESGVSGIER